MKPEPEVKEYIDQFASEFREVLYCLCELVYEVVPEVTEAIKWGMPTFSFQGKNICYIAGFKNHVTFAFHDGTMLNDSQDRLKGTGKYMRYIKLRNLQEIDEEQMKIWILEGFYH